MDYFSSILVLFILGMVNFTLGTMAVRKFLETHAVIGGYGDLSDFKSMVRKQMYQALIQILLLGGMTVISVIGILTDELTFTQFVMVLVLDGIVWFAGKKGKTVEQRAQGLGVQDPELREEYKSVCRTWVIRPFPDF
jgi:hypothetical protein